MRIRSHSATRRAHMTARWVGIGVLLGTTVAGAVALAPPAQASEVLATFTSPTSTTWTVPAGVTLVRIEAWGASGGGAYNSGYGANGAKVSQVLQVTPGDEYPIVVGGVGGHGGWLQSGPGLGGFNGGGDGGDVGVNGAGAGGGGRTDVLLPGGAPFIIAGGGGGGYGGPGGRVGGDGAPNGASSGGKGATTTAGGAGGTEGGSDPGQSGSVGQGGAGITDPNCRYTGHGGGGGLYGGGGGSCEWNGSGGGGGGGSSLVPEEGIVDSDVFADNDGNGKVVITHILPVLDSEGPVSPSSGPGSGNTAITLHGSGFTGVTGVSFGGVAVNSFTVLFDGQIATRTPEGAPGTTVDIVVEGPDGSDTAVGAYTYLPAPAISGLNPEAGALVGDDLITVTGSGFDQNTTVSFGGTPATSVMVTSESSLTAVTPSNSTAGSVDVTVSNDNGSGTLADGFSYVSPPEVTSVTPASGPLAGGTDVDVVGSGLATLTSVEVGGIDVTSSVSDVLDDGFRFTTPAGAEAGPVNVQVRTAGGELVLTGAFTYISPPTIVAPGAPRTVTAVPGDRRATVSWVAPVSNGGSAITRYTVTSTPGGRRCTTNGARTCVVGNLRNGTAYSFSVTARNVAGTGPASAASSSVTPVTPGMAPQVSAPATAGFLTTATILASVGSPAATLLTATPRTCRVDGVSAVFLSRAGQCRISVIQAGRTVARVKVVVRANGPGRALDSATVIFGRDQSNITDAGMAVLEGLVTQLRDADVVVVTGYINGKPKTSRGARLSRDRAAAVARYLAERGVTVTWYGSGSGRSPVTGGPSANRRAVISWS